MYDTRRVWLTLFIVVPGLPNGLVTASRPYYSPDFDESEFVDFEDFAAFSENWKHSGTGVDGDFDNNGISYNYDISDQADILSYSGLFGTWSSGSNNAKDNLEEHNHFDSVYWYDTLMPATQCGYQSPIDARTTFTRQNLCQPVGHKGGN